MEQVKEREKIIIFISVQPNLNMLKIKISSRVVTKKFESKWLFDSTLPSGWTSYQKSSCGFPATALSHHTILE
jgi:hypothetical protein